MVDTAFQILIALWEIRDKVSPTKTEVGTLSNGIVTMNLLQSLLSAAEPLDEEMRMT